MLKLKNMAKKNKNMIAELDAHNHEVEVYVYSPDDLKIVNDKIAFTISYHLKRRSNMFGIFVNDNYCGLDLNIAKVDEEKSYSPKDLIGLSISHYLNGEFSEFKVISRMETPNRETKNLYNRNFKNHVCSITKFATRDELTRLNLIIER